MTKQHYFFFKIRPLRLRGGTGGYVELQVLNGDQKREDNMTVEQMMWSKSYIFGSNEVWYGLVWSNTQN